MTSGFSSILPGDRLRFSIFFLYFFLLLYFVCPFQSSEKTDGVEWNYEMCVRDQRKSQ